MDDVEVGDEVVVFLGPYTVDAVKAVVVDIGENGVVDLHVPAYGVDVYGVRYSNGPVDEQHHTWLTFKEYDGS